MAITSPGFMPMRLLNRLSLTSSFLLPMSWATAATPLKLSVYNPGTEAMFPVSSVLGTGAKEAILVDAQFGVSQADKLVEAGRQGRQTLTTVHMSHGDPGDYFLLVSIQVAFADGRIVATP